MIPQADVTWFVPQILWTTGFLVIQICINQFLIFKRPIAKSKQIALESIMSKIKIIKEDVSSLKNHRAEIEVVIQREESALRSEAVSQQNSIFIELVKKLKSVIKKARKQINSYTIDLDLIDAKKIATKFLKKVGEE